MRLIMDSPEGDLLTYLTCCNAFIRDHGLSAMCTLNNELKEIFPSPEVTFFPKAFELSNIDAKLLATDDVDMLAQEHGALALDNDVTAWTMCYLAKFGRGPPTQVTMMLKHYLDAKKDEVHAKLSMCFATIVRQCAALGFGSLKTLQLYLLKVQPFQVGDVVHSLSTCVENGFHESKHTITEVKKCKNQRGRKWFYKTRTNDGYQSHFYDDEYGLCLVSYPLDVDLWAELLNMEDDRNNARMDMFDYYTDDSDGEIYRKDITGASTKPYSRRPRSRF
jgi:hypothetical protein